MPWKECSVMDERLHFVARRLPASQWQKLASKSTISVISGCICALPGAGYNLPDIDAARHF